MTHVIAPDQLGRIGSAESEHLRVDAAELDRRNVRHVVVEREHVGEKGGLLQHRHESGQGSEGHCAFMTRWASKTRR